MYLIKCVQQRPKFFLWLRLRGISFAQLAHKFGSGQTASGGAPL
jgi:hypothetical protein